MATQTAAQAQTAKIQAGQDAANAASAAKVSQSNSSLPSGVGYQTFNTDGSVNKSYSDDQTKTMNATGVAPSTSLPTDPATGLNTPPSATPVPPAGQPVDAAKTGAVSYEEAQKNLAAGGLAGTDLSTAQSSLAKSYNQPQQNLAALQASGPAPQDKGAAMSGIASALPKQGNTAVADEVLAANKAHQDYIDTYTKSQESGEQNKSLTETYKQLSKDLGIETLNTQLMNMKNVIDGTEDDIRNEVTKAGGFATDSQVLAMSNARNKTMIKNYNNLLETRNNAQQNLTTMIGLASQDRAFASEQIDKQLNFKEKEMEFAQKAVTNAQTALKNTADAIGWAGVLKHALATGDPTAVQRIESTMGTGFDLHAAATHVSLDDQLKQAQLSNIYSEIHARNNPAPKAQTQAQVVAQGYAQRATAANAKISSLGSKFTDITAIGGILPTVLQSSERQEYEQAKREFINSVLRPESGASISPSEFSSAAKEYFPTAGDSSKVVAQKAVDRQLKINSLQQQGTNTSVPETGQLVTYQGKQYTVDTNGEMTPI